MFIKTLMLLLAGHAICDYPLQGEFLSKGKNHKSPVLGIPSAQILFAHAMIHSGMVLLITGSAALAVAELAVHFVTDWMKCDERISFNRDQAIHYACKLLWAVIAAHGDVLR